MPAATSKAALLAVTEKEFDHLWTTLSDIDERSALEPDADGTSIRDVVVHRAHWIELYLGWYRDGVAGKPVETPAPGYKWNQLKAYNAKVREQNRNVTWKTAKQRLRRKHTALLKLLSSLSDQELYGAKKFDWTNTWTLGRWGESSGASHYRSARGFVRKHLRALV
ncbi:MAG: ClbS/DfsB family four-helix bundle protein [Myxococcota bacterium]